MQISSNKTYSILLKVYQYFSEIVMHQTLNS